MMFSFPQLQPKQETFRYNGKKKFGILYLNILQDPKIHQYMLF